MNLLTLEFWPVFIVFVIIYYLVSLKLQNALLLIANIAFISFWGWQSLLVLIISLILSYLTYVKITDSSLEHSVKKIYLSLFIAIQISLLFYFKIVTTIFPLGISYYSFIIIAYLLEVFWKRTDLRLSLFEYAISVSFFPIIMMGPIERLSKFSPQLRAKREFTAKNFEMGIYHIALGLFKLTAISNILAPLIQHNSSIAQNIYGLGMIAYCMLAFFQLYAEFSGFIDVITGLSFFLGLRISKNFERPYFASNVNDVWRRWHISLTSWVRDFVFMPMVLKTRNIVFSSIVVFAVVAVWHGINLTFFYWGLYWVSFYLIHLVFLKRPVHLPAFLKTSVTLLITSLSTLCFLMPISGFINVLSRLVKIDLASFQSILQDNNILQTNFWFILLSIVLMMAFENFDTKNFSKFLKTKTILLFFLIALLGHFTLNSLSYLRV